MPDHVRLVPDLPFETADAARRVYNIHNIYLQIGDHLEEILASIQLAVLDATASLSSEMIARLALVSCFQIAENMPDVFAAEATLSRMDWKYALHLPLHYPGMRAGALCLFRQNLYCSPAGIVEFGRLFICLGKFGLYAPDRSNTLIPLDRLTILCNTNRLHQLGQAMQAALSTVTAVAPSWVRSHMRSHWYEHYRADRSHTSSYSASIHPQEEAFALSMDIQWLLKAVEQLDSPQLSNQTEIIQLRQIWEEQFIHDGDDIFWRTPGCASCCITTSNYPNNIQAS
jgi:hypothetical protein